MKGATYAHQLMLIGIKLTNDDWDKTKKICDKLKKFYDATELFSGTKYRTIVLFYPKVCEIRLALEKWKCSKYTATR